MARSSLSVRLYALIGLFALSIVGLSAFSLYSNTSHFCRSGSGN